MDTVTVFDEIELAVPGPPGKMAAAALPPSWYIRISNQSGSTQSYALYSAEPVVAASMKPPKIYTNVVAVADNVQTKTGVATFNLRKQLQTICGQLELDDDPDSMALFGENQPHPPSVASIVEVIDKRPVSLGSKAPSGEVTPGTQWEIEIVDNETPRFGTISSRGGNLGAFCLKTRNDFTGKDAKSKHYFVGFGGPMTQTVGPYSVWVPAPNQTYQITPVTTFYIIIDDVEPRSVPTDAQKAGAVKIDFAELGYDSVKLVHDNNGNLNILKPGSDLG